MAYKVIYKKRFSNKLVKLLQYIEGEWGQKVAKEFLDKLDKRIATLKEQPFIGKPSERKPEVRTILITKHNKLYYKLTNTAIIILNMYDTRSNPKKNPYGF
jgi:plasmid stabilization system protein ParE